MSKTTTTGAWPKFYPRRYKLSTCPVMSLVPRRCLQYFPSFYKAANVTPVANWKGKFVISHFLERDIGGVKWYCLAEWNSKQSCYLRCAEPDLRTPEFTVYSPAGLPRVLLWNTTPRDPGQYFLCLCGFCSNCKADFQALTGVTSTRLYLKYIRVY